MPLSYIQYIIAIYFLYSSCTCFVYKHQNTLTVLQELASSGFPIRLHFQLFHLNLLDLFNLLFPSRLLLLNQDGITLCHAPVIRARHGRTEWTSTCRLHILPVSSPCPGPHPRLCVHLKTLPPHHVLFTPSRLLAALFHCELFSQCPDVVGLKPAASADVAHSQLPSLSGELVHVPPGADSWLKTEGELRKVDKALLSSIRGVERKRLAHEVGLQTGCIKARLHLAKALQGDKGVEVAVDSHNVGSRLGHPDRALGGGHAVHVTLGPNAHVRCNWEGSLQALLDSPLNFLNVLEVLTKQEVQALRDKHINLFLELLLHISLGHA